jgi:uncharacterized C2H2 Zn-finger protein
MGILMTVEVKLEDLIHCPRCGMLLTRENFHSEVEETEADKEYRWVKCDCGWETDC